MLQSSQLTQPRNPRNNSGSSSSTSTTIAQASNAVTLICFGAPLALVNRFETLAKDFSCGDVMQDPYILFDLVLEELFALIDQVAWLLGDVFGEIETVGDLTMGIWVDRDDADRGALGNTR